MKSSTKKLRQEPNKNEIHFLKYFIFSKDYIDSSIFAVHFLKLTHADESTWLTLENEYYWCPIFRYEHAVFYSKSGNNMNALSRLLELTEEFPWFKTGVLSAQNAIIQIRHLYKDETLMIAEMSRLEEHISRWKS